MEIKDIKPTTEATFKVIGTDGSEQTVSFTVSFLGAHMIPDYVQAGGARVRLSKIVQDALVDVVTAWNLTMDEKPIPCTDENKQKFFPAILGLRLTPDPDVPDAERGLNEYLGWALVNFAGEYGNFLKN